jgi:histidinol-phosphatase (PHP family)
MEKENYHTHTTGSDGSLSPEELIKLAIKKHFKVIGITDHYHFPPGFRNWGNEFYSEKHYKELNKLKANYKDKIKIFINVEFDWLKDYKSFLKQAVKRHYDYKFISIHYLKAKAEYLPIDDSPELFEKIIQAKGNIRRVVKSYYHELRKAIRTGWFDVVSHLDLIKIWNKDKKYFSGEESWYKNEIRKTLNLIKRKNLKLELNMKGLLKPCDEQYPSLSILSQIKSLSIPILVGTDAHNAGELDFALDKAEKLLFS